MKKLGLLVLLVILSGINQCAAASHHWQNQVGRWAEPNKWTGEGIPNGNSEVLIRYADSRCILDSNAGDWSVAQRLRVYGNANLEICDGGCLLGVSWMRAGTGDGPACVKQTGGIVRLKGGRDNSKLTIGYEDGSQGSKYTISGGTITFLDADAYLIVGYRGGEGTLTVIGTDPKIEMRKLYVGGDLVEKAGSGSLEFKIASDGVSPVRLSESIHIDREGKTSTANLIVSAIAEPPKADIVLVEDKGYGGIEGSFDMLTDARGTSPADEGADVVLKYGDTEYHYELTYKYDAAKDGNTNDIGLVYKPEPVVTKQ